MINQLSSNENIKSDLEAVCSLIKIPWIEAIATKLLALPGNKLETIEISGQDLEALKFNRKYVYAKLVKLPSALRPALGLHYNTDQLTLVVFGSLVWVQASKQFVPEVFESGKSIYTEANDYHGHATGREPAIVLALFTSTDVKKDSLKDFDWTDACKIID